MKKIMLSIMAILMVLPVLFAQKKAGKKDTVTHINLYACPKHPGVVTDQPGKCPFCRMDLNLSQKELLKTQVIKAYTCPIHADVVSDKAGTCPKCGTSLNLSLKERMKAGVVGIYTCPMHADVKSDKPGKCPTYGMALVKKS